VRRIIDVRTGAAVALTASAVATWASPAAAHGVGSRGDLPLPFWQFAWGAAVAVLISFAALGVLWTRSRLPDSAVGVETRPWLDRGLRLAAWPARLLSLALFALVLAAGIGGTDSVAANVAPVTVYIALWVGLQVLSALVGDIWRSLSPFETIADGLDAVGRAVGRPLPDPDRTFSYWPAVGAISGFLWLELGYHEGSLPRTVGWAGLLYSIAIVAGTLRWGRGWLRSSEGFGVLFGLLSHMAPLFRDDAGRLRLRPPLSGLGTLRLSTDRVAFVLVVLGSTTFDGFSGSELWSDLVGRRSGWELTIVNTFGLVWLIGVVALLYVAATRAVAVRTDQTPAAAATSFGPSLVPIVFGYAVAHYFSLLVLDGQSFYIQLSDPFGRGADWFGTADWVVNFLLVGTATIAWVQLIAIVVGHVGGVLVAHDKAIETGDASSAVSSQYPMLAVMVVYSVGGLWLLMSA
jgi:hypothetical protein